MVPKFILVRIEPDSNSEHMHIRDVKCLLPVENWYYALAILCGSKDEKMSRNRNVHLIKMYAAQLREQGSEEFAAKVERFLEKCGSLLLSTTGTSVITDCEKAFVNTVADFILGATSSTGVALVDDENVRNAVSWLRPYSVTLSTIFCNFRFGVFVDRVVGATNRRIILQVEEAGEPDTDAHDPGADAHETTASDDRT